MSEVPPPPPTPPAAPPPGGAPVAMSPSDQRLWATLIHIGGIFFGVLAPLIGFLVLKDRGNFVREHTATALNFQLTMLIAYIVGWVLSIILVGLLIVAAVWVVIIVFSIIAAMKANGGEAYKYPLTISFVK
jgi:uncharacterized protein